MDGLKLGLKEIEDDAGLGVRDRQDFARRFRVFLDDLRHLKWLNHFEIDVSSARSDPERARLLYYQAEAQKIRRSVWKSLGHFDDSLAGLRQLFANMDLYLDRPDLRDMKMNRPASALIIAAGPSLDESLDLLQRDIERYGRRFLIVAVDAALKACLKRHIEPHAVTVIERDDHSLKFVQNLPSALSSVLVLHPLCKREIMETYPGPIAFASKLTGPFMWLPFQRPHFISGSSSAHLAYQVAASLGATRVALMAQDLCFHPETLQSHGKVEDYPAWSEAQTRDTLLKNLNGSDEIWEAPGNTYPKVLTTSTWRLFAEDFAMLLAEKPIPTVNTSRLGIQLSAAPYQPLNEFLKSEPSINAVDVDLPAKNPRAEHETQAFTTKRKEALTSLERLSQEILKHREASGKELKDFYELFILKPHFLELCLELIFREWVEAENRLITLETASESSHPADQLRRELLDRAMKAIEEVLNIFRHFEASRP